ncbi:MAG: L,D-transpeptidase family protein [Roseovarius sp.]|nr:L,D-transpeptidase family protein [Roseovarius sp.]
MSGLRGLGAVLGMLLVLVATGARAGAEGQGQGQGQDQAVEAAFRLALIEAAADDPVLADYYRETGYAPLWMGEGAADRARRAALLDALTQAQMHGLPAARHDATALMARPGDILSMSERGRAEMDFSRAYLAYAHDLQGGILDPSQVDSDIKRTVLRPEAAELLDAMRTGAPDARLRALAPQTGEYRRLQAARQHLEAIVAGAGWGPEVPALTLRPGAVGPEVVALRNRLAAMGYLARGAAEPDDGARAFDDTLAAVVQAFQRDHGLAPDGVVGPRTIAALNTPPEDRLRAVIVAMERERWLPVDRGARHVMVNLADFSARLIDGDRITFETRAVIGKNAGNRRSPEFSDEIEYMVINPTWHVPRSIVARDYLPRLQADRNAAPYMKIYDRQGREVPRGAVNFNAYDGRSFPFAMKQPPSDGNALGRVKFMFPNRWSIYLHDTPHKHLFERERRDFSSGCIRLERPFDLAYALLARQEDDPEGFFHAILATGRETYVHLEDHVPVHLIYRTAFTRPGERMQYRDDVYGRDARIWEALARAGVTPGGQGS